MNTLRPQRADTTVGPPLRILSLDGGGIRGYSMLIILQELMHMTFVELEGRPPKKHEIPKPCDHFDLIVGTGTGGLIALMLGRLRLSVDTCKDVYVRMTRKVFETDKTIAGIPYRSTLFKASKLEEAIRECVKEHTVFSDEGNDDPNAPTQQDLPPMVPGSALRRAPQRSLSVSSRYSQIGNSTVDVRSPAAWPGLSGNPGAPLYDYRETRTKTAVTAVYKGSKKGSAPALLRSYDSRKQTAAEDDCTIWQAGRATCATALAFKPIQIGHSNFLDEGNGKYNPAPLALDEAVLNEWPGRDIGVFVSIGTGKRPHGTQSQQHLWWESFVGGNIGDFAEARRRLMSKIEGCEDTHQEMITGRLAERGVNTEHYYRLNVEVGVGEFGMNEWNRLSEISTSTRMYLAQTSVQSMNLSAAIKLSRVKKHQSRWNRAIANGQTPDAQPMRNSWEYVSEDNEPEPPTIVGAIELPAEDVPESQYHYLFGPPSRTSQITINSQSSHPPNPPPRIPLDHSPPLSMPGGHRFSHSQSHSPRPPPPERPSSDDDKFVVYAPEPSQYNRISQMSDLEPRRSHEIPPKISLTPPSSRLGFAIPAQPARPHNPNEPPPIPPKTPLTSHVRPYTESAPPMPGMQSTMSRPPVGINLPYPDTDGPPPAVNTARKPEFGMR